MTVSWMIVLHLGCSVSTPSVCLKLMKHFMATCRAVFTIQFTLLFLINLEN